MRELLGLPSFWQILQIFLRLLSPTFLTGVETSSIQRHLSAEHMAYGFHSDYYNWGGSQVQDSHLMDEESESRQSDTQRRKMFDIKHQTGLTQTMSCLKYSQERIIHRSKLMPCKHFLSVTGAVYRAGVTGSRSALFGTSSEDTAGRALWKLQCFWYLLQPELTLAAWNFPCWWFLSGDNRDGYVTEAFWRVNEIDVSPKLCQSYNSHSRNAVNTSPFSLAAYLRDLWPPFILYILSKFLVLVFLSPLFY